MSRGSGPEHENYLHLHIDLSDPVSLNEFNFPELNEAESISLVNNAAMISEITHSGRMSSENIIRDYNTSLVSPTILCNEFIRRYQGYGSRRTIMNIGSGASKMAMESWSAYCASKAGLEMLSNVIDTEQKLRHAANPVRVFNALPGVVDTMMQDVIRGVSEDVFSDVERFRDFKRNNQLKSPEVVASKLIRILDRPESFSSVSLHINDINTD